MEGLKGRHVKKGLKKLLAVSNTEEGPEQAEKFQEFNDYVEEVVCEVKGLSPQQLDEMEYDEVDKLKREVKDKIRGEMDFANASMKPQS